MKRKGLSVTREEIKEKIKAKNNKIKRYQSRINQYQQNRNFKNNQGKFYRELNSGGRNYETTEVPDKKEAQEFWGSIWGERKDHEKDAEWLENFKRYFEYKEEQEKGEITPEKIKKILRKMPKWKTPGPDFVQGFWLKIFKSIQEGLAKMLRKWKRADVDDKRENNTNTKRQGKGQSNKVIIDLLLACLWFGN